MTFLFWVKVIVAVATMGFGVMLIVSPLGAERFTGLPPIPGYDTPGLTYHP